MCEFKDTFKKKSKMDISSFNVEQLHYLKSKINSRLVKFSNSILFKEESDQFDNSNNTKIISMSSINSSKQIADHLIYKPKQKSLLAKELEEIQKEDSRQISHAKSSKIIPISQFETMNYGSSKPLISLNNNDLSKSQKFPKNNFFKKNNSGKKRNLLSGKFTNHKLRSSRSAQQHNQIDVKPKNVENHKIKQRNGVRAKSMRTLRMQLNRQSRSPRPPQKRINKEIEEDSDIGDSNITVKMINQQIEKMSNEIGIKLF